MRAVNHWVRCERAMPLWAWKKLAAVLMAIHCCATFCSDNMATPGMRCPGRRLLLAH